MCLHQDTRPILGNVMTGCVCVCMCVLGGRCFRRESNKVCHKCAAERRKPVCEQAGAVQCECCGGWFRSRGGLAVHSCSRQEQVARSEVSAEGVMCSVCGRNFRQPGDMKRHKCREERSKPVEDQRWFRSARGLSVHKMNFHDK